MRSELVVFSAKLKEEKEIGVVEVSGASDLRLYSQHRLERVSKLPRYVTGVEFRYSNSHGVEVVVGLEGAQENDPDANLKRKAALHESCVYIVKAIGGESLSLCSNLDNDWMYSYQDLNNPAHKANTRQLMQQLEQFESSDKLTRFGNGNHLRNLHSNQIPQVGLRKEKVYSGGSRVSDPFKRSDGYARWDRKMGGWVKSLVDENINKFFGNISLSQNSAYVRISPSMTDSGEYDIFMMVDLENRKSEQSFRVNLGEISVYNMDESSAYGRATILSGAKNESSFVQLGSPPLNYKRFNIRVERDLEQTGLFTMLNTRIYFPSKSVFHGKRCFLAVVDSIPDTVFIDLDELRDTEKKYSFQILNDMHIELPSFQSQHNVLVSIVEQNMKGWVNLSVPIHFRYQEPSESSQFRSAKIPDPLLYIACPSPRPCDVISYPLFPNRDAAANSCPSWTHIPHYSVHGASIDKQVPVGDANLVQVVDSVTLISALLGFVLILIAILGKNKTKTD